MLDVIVCCTDATGFLNLSKAPSLSQCTCSYFYSLPPCSMPGPVSASLSLKTLTAWANEQLWASRWHLWLTPRKHNLVWVRHYLINRRNVLWVPFLPLIDATHMWLKHIQYIYTHIQYTYIKKERLHSNCCETKETGLKRDSWNYREREGPRGGMVSI